MSSNPYKLSWLWVWTCIQLVMGSSWYDAPRCCRCWFHDINKRVDMRRQGEFCAFSSFRHALCIVCQAKKLVTPTIQTRYLTTEGYQRVLNKGLFSATACGSHHWHWHQEVEEGKIFRSILRSSLDMDGSTWRSFFVRFWGSHVSGALLFSIGHIMSSYHTHCSSS